MTNKGLELLKALSWKYIYQQIQLDAIASSNDTCYNQWLVENNADAAQILKEFEALTLSEKLEAIYQYGK